jgi:hypothetical protein
VSQPQQPSLNRSSSRLHEAPLDCRPGGERRGGCSARALEELDVVDDYKDAKKRFGSNFLESVDSLPQFKGLASFSGQLR